MRLKCLDIYPYAKAAPLSLVQHYLPELTAMTMRPHATEFFWAGLDVPHFPDFKKLDTLLLDSINLGIYLSFMFQSQKIVRFVHAYS